MANYVTNGQISVPLSLPDLKPDVDLGGMKFSYTHGIFFSPVTVELPIRLPPPYSTGPGP